jgi:S1-C subfamily serine protease
MVRQDLYKLLQECTVRLSSSSGIGTGFFIAPGGWILTCEHVVEQSERVEVLWLSGERQQELTAAVKLRVPIPVDLALLQLEGKAPAHTAV